ncbi:MAG: hypothetical protein AVDCRST_MAG15-1944, partial [uncultured Rubellimicrobium sp.]
PLGRSGGVRDAHRPRHAARPHRHDAGADHGGRGRLLDHAQGQGRPRRLSARHGGPDPRRLRPRGGLPDHPVAQRRPDAPARRLGHPGPCRQRDQRDPRGSPRHRHGSQLRRGPSGHGPPPDRGDRPRHRRDLRPPGRDRLPDRLPRHDQRPRPHRLCRGRRTRGGRRRGRPHDPRHGGGGLRLHAPGPARRLCFPGQRRHALLPPPGLRLRRPRRSCRCQLPRAPHRARPSTDGV